MAKKRIENNALDLVGNRILNAKGKPWDGSTGAIEILIDELLKSTLPTVTLFGADRTATNDSSTAFRDASWAAGHVTGYAVSRGLMIVPPGEYRLSTPIPIDTGTCILMHKGAVLRWYGAQNLPMFVFYGGDVVVANGYFEGSDSTHATAPSAFLQWSIDGMNTIDSRFGGAGYWGSMLTAGVATIRDCAFHRPNEVAVKIYHGTSGPNFRNSQTSYVLDDVRFYGRQFWFGTSDYMITTGGRMDWIPDSANHALVTQGGVCVFDDVMGVSQGTPAAGQTWFQGDGTFDIKGFRFGESPAPFFTIKNTTSIPTLPIDAQGCIVKVTGCMAHSAADLVHAYDNFPNQISVRDNWHYNGSSFLSSGIWVKDTLLPTVLANRHDKSAMFIDLDDHTYNGGDFVIRSSATPDQVGSNYTNVMERFRKYFRHYDRWHAGNAPATATNLWFDGVFQPDGVSMGVLVGTVNGAPGYATNAGWDTTSQPGYAINRYIFGSGSGDGYMGVSNAVSWPPAAWSSLPAGEYCFSIWVKANWAIEADICIKPWGDGVAIGIASGRGTVIKADTWRRIWCPFYYDGSTGQKISVVLNKMNQLNLAFETWGVMINRGIEPPLYYSPPVASENTLDGFIERKMFSNNTAPTDTLKRGDRIVNVMPRDGGISEWVNTGDGTPGTLSAVVLHDTRDFFEAGHVRAGQLITSTSPLHEVREEFEAMRSGTHFIATSSHAGGGAGTQNGFSRYLIQTSTTASSRALRRSGQFPIPALHTGSQNSWYLRFFFRRTVSGIGSNEMSAIGLMVSGNTVPILCLGAAGTGYANGNATKFLLFRTDGAAAPAIGASTPSAVNADASRHLLELNFDNNTSTTLVSASIDGETPITLNVSALATGAADIAFFALNGADTTDYGVEVDSFYLKAVR